MVLTQQERMLKLSTPLGKDVLLLTGFSGQEEISRLFRFQLEMISDNNVVTAADIVGQNVTFSVELSDGSPRFFNGFVNQFVAGDEEHGRRNYRAEVVPWLWFLTQTADCRLFQDKTIKDIIETIFGDLGFSDYKFDLQLDHKKWEYCVQYRETDFNFVSRLMEQEGVSYWFKHADGKHEMVISDHKGAYYDLIEKEVEYPPNVGGAAITDHITSWEHRYEFRPGKWAQTDYNFKTPSTNL
ncbi:MAG: type VI secretion system tip protein VgrG, partial [Planctomycetia bacterium]|nr:type VI secretion system tip protein VgrG [Planctomycetia bacterium]